MDSSTADRRAECATAAHLTGANQSARLDPCALHRAPPLKRSPSPIDSAGMRRQVFEQLIIKAIESLPPRVRENLENVAFVLEERPRASVARQHGVRSGGFLLGLYEGVPRTVWGRDFSGKLPDKISIFQEPIERLAAEEGSDVATVVCDTVWHEVGHYLGFSEREIRRREQRWRRRAGR